MSKNSIKLVYRYLCKNINVLENRLYFRETLTTEIENLNSLNDSTNQQSKLAEYEKFQQDYLKMKFHIDNENRLLESYNINVVRDSKREIVSVARKVGLEI
jgi:hypothetical protein